MLLAGRIDLTLSCGPLDCRQRAGAVTLEQILLAILVLDLRLLLTHVRGLDGKSRVRRPLCLGAADGGLSSAIVCCNDSRVIATRCLAIVNGSDLRRVHLLRHHYASLHSLN